MLSATKLAGLLAEPDRRRVVAALILASGSLDDVVAATGLDRRTTAEAIDRLVGSGLVEVDAEGRHVVLEEAFKLAARSAAEASSVDPGRVDQSADERILGNSIVDGRLVHLPRKRSKRLIVLDHIAQRFEPGVRYRERQVNAMLSELHADVPALRRHLVDERFVDRAGGEYWRSGGTVDTSAGASAAGNEDDDEPGGG